MIFKIQDDLLDIIFQEYQKIISNQGEVDKNIFSFLKNVGIMLDSDITIIHHIFTFENIDSFQNKLDKYLQNQSIDDINLHNNKIITIFNEVLQKISSETISQDICNKFIYIRLTEKKDLLDDYKNINISFKSFNDMYKELIKFNIYAENQTDAVLYLNMSQILYSNDLTEHNLVFDVNSASFNGVGGCKEITKSVESNHIENNSIVIVDSDAVSKNDRNQKSLEIQKKRDILKKNNKLSIFYMLIVREKENILRHTDYKKLIDDSNFVKAAGLSKLKISYVNSLLNKMTNADYVVDDYYCDYGKTIKDRNNEFVDFYDKNKFDDLKKQNRNYQKDCSLIKSTFNDMLNCIVNNTNTIVSNNNYSQCIKDHIFNNSDEYTDAIKISTIITSFLISKRI